jgi:hypothetical protein
LGARKRLVHAARSGEQGPPLGHYIVDQHDSIWDYGRGLEHERLIVNTHGRAVARRRGR